MTNLAQDTEEVTSRTVSCKGGSNNISEGHPKVWLKIPVGKDYIVCPYCDKTFILRL
ncbi:MAG: zinc-finger domain-containing protein [Rhodobacteraceae bacterium]|nr:MAG: zinc-finger domain-containing protein [Paracoccaceae bacterium]